MRICRSCCRPRGSPTCARPAHALRDLTERLLEAHQLPDTVHQPYLLLCASVLDADTAWEFADVIDKAGDIGHPGRPCQHGRPTLSRRGDRQRLPQHPAAPRVHRPRGHRPAPGTRRLPPDHHR
ncbi:hypothetical protein LV779_18300 [Streptomyces thinghirensis]|nr:hypothetical protein [Streptomyces thinghirensis]